MRYVQGIHPNVPAQTMFIDIYSYRNGLNRPRHGDVPIGALVIDRPTDRQIL